MVKLKRVYEKAERGDGYRILVDRLWPRGVSKEKAALDLWLKEIAPTDGLRKWFGHDPKRWAGFQKRYLAEVRANKEALAELRGIAKREKTVTLLFAAKDEANNEAVVLKKLLSR